ncbi:MAG: MBL fold metallo-hydrolase [Pseudomonadota bacterium]
MEQAGAKLRYPFETPPLEGEAIEVAPGILWMRLPLPMALDHVNIYALDDGDGWTIIDTGFASKRGQALWENLIAGPLQGRPINRCVVTHHHPDHVGMAAWLLETQGASLWMTRTAYLWTRMLQLDVQDRPSAETLQFWTRAGIDADVLETRKNERPFNFADCTKLLPLGYNRLQQGDEITMGGRKWAVHIGHGHAAEHATFWSLDDDLVIAGDQILPSISPNLGVYATEPEADPVGDWLESCARFKSMARPEHFVLGGHKLPFLGLPLRMQQLIDNHHGALARLEQFLDSPKSAGQCFQPLFKREIRGGEYGLAMVEAFAHCQHLWKTGRASRVLSDEGAYLYQAI